MEELKFEEGTLLVIEVKTTLGKSRTPGFLKTQAVGGGVDTARIQNLVLRQRQGWNPKKLSEANPQFEDIANALFKAVESGKASYIHAQVFFDSTGTPSNIAGPTAGVQLNRWD
ncbi:hypothetical protein [uncultured Pseudomonas sp.]|uniref:hypothetical protein n=1 Tax=uncultured Pseudomonas sp. TaxID=114707 RepID=UPI0025FD9D9D|nr:hypothetical protein [uncultured Pseudomonas sp.]